MAAGFIGQFGKRLADYLLARRRNRKKAEADRRLQEGAKTAAAPDETGPRPHVSPPTETTPTDRTDAKVVKKLAKADVKKAKKSP